MTAPTRARPEPRRRPALAPGAPLAMAFALSLAGAVDARGQVGREVGVIQTSAFDESSFLQAIFGDSIKAATGPDHLDALLMAAVADVDRHCSLTEAQRARIVLAGRGDGKRFLDRVAEARRACIRLGNDPESSQEILNIIRPLGAQFEAGLYGEGSFFAKSLGSTLTTEQHDRRGQALAEKARFRYKAKVALVLASLDPVVGFTSEQQRRYLALILESTTPPRRAAGTYEANVVLSKIAAIPEDRIRAIFEEAQCKALARIFRQARESEAFLRDNGYLD